MAGNASQKSNQPWLGLTTDFRSPCGISRNTDFRTIGPHFSTIFSGIGRQMTNTPTLILCAMAFVATVQPDAVTHGGGAWPKKEQERSLCFTSTCPGSVGKSTHAGLPWLRYIRSHAPCTHFWPFDGWNVPPGRSVVAEVYPSLWRRGFAQENRNDDQHDAFSAAEWMRRSDTDDTLRDFFAPTLSPAEMKAASIEGWILGIK